MRAPAVLIALAAASLAAAVVMLGVGEFPLSPAEVVAAIGGDGFAHRVVVEWRAPRLLAALLCGAALGASGAVFQTITRNPLGSPDVIGLGSGAYVGVLAALLLLGAGSGSATAGAVLGALATGAVVFLLAARGGGAALGLRLVLVGIAAGGLLQAVATWLLLSARLEEAKALSVWGLGGLAGVGWHDLGWPLLAGGAAAAALAALRRPLRQSELGDELAASTGARPVLVRMLAGLAGVVLVASAAAIAGPVAFVALIAPHCARMLTGRSGYRPLDAAVTGAALLLAAEIVGQRLLAPSQLPVGIVTVCLGGVFLVGLLAASARRDQVRVASS